MSNTTSGVHEAFHYRKFEALTPRLRMLMAHAPYDYFVGPILRDLKDIGEARATRDFVARCFGDRDSELRAVYSPDHPQIGSRVPERRRA